MNINYQTNNNKKVNILSSNLFKNLSELGLNDGFFNDFLKYLLNHKYVDYNKLNDFVSYSIENYNEKDSIQIKYIFNSFLSSNKFELSKKEEIYLIKNVQQNNDLNSKNLLLTFNLGIIQKTINYFDYLNINKNDLKQEAIIAFFESVNEFDLSKNNRLITYSFVYIKNKLFNYISKNYKDKKINKTNKAIKDYIIKFSNEYFEINKKLPTVEVIYNSFYKKFDEKKFNNFFDIYSSSYSSNFYTNKAYINEFYQDLITEDEYKDIFDEYFSHNSLEYFLNKLSKREKNILILKNGLDGHYKRKLSEIAAIYVVSVERIRQINSKALYNLKNIIYYEIENLSEKNN